MQQADRDRAQFRLGFGIVTSQTTYPVVEVTGNLFIGNVVNILRERSVVDIMEE